MGLTLVLGGTRSGKSAHAEALARAGGLPVRYVATADEGDATMAARIAAHAARRPPDWETVVAREALSDVQTPGRCILVDGLGAWIAGVLHRAGTFDGRPVPETLRAEVDAFAQAAAEATSPTIVVAELAGEGVLPAAAGARTWLDALGEATATLSAAADRAILVVAGRAIELPAARTDTAGERGGAGRAAAVGTAAPAGAGAELAALRHHGDAAVAPGELDFAVNVLAGGPPPWLRAVLREALDAGAGTYPREDAAVAALAALHGRAPAEIVPCNGAAQALWLVPAAVRPQLAACVHPGFTEAEAALRVHGVPVVRVHRDPEDGFALDPTAVPEAADLVMAGNPASPSGTLDPAAALLALRRPGRIVVVDEAFMDLVPGEPASLVRERLQDVVVVRSLTKSLSIPGLRAGYAVAAAPVADRLRAVRPPWSVNALALAALHEAALRPDALAAAAERAQAERADLERRLAAIDGIRRWPAAANFVLVEVPDGARVVARLHRAGIAVRSAASFPGLSADHLRLSARGPGENAQLAAALADALQPTPEPVR